TGFRVDPSVVLQLGSEMANHESSVLSEFLSFVQRGVPIAEGLDGGGPRSNPSSGPPSMHAVGSPETDSAALAGLGGGVPHQRFPQHQPRAQTAASGAKTISLPTITQLMAGASGNGVTQTERFVMTAADPTDGTAEEKLHQIIHAKQEAGILKPYNYGGGYARMQRFLEANVSPVNIVRILEVVNTIRPMFRKTARSLTDADLVAVEEGFERLLLDYDNQFNAFGVPACLWRRTGEIYKANREFADLVGMPLSVFHEGRVCIYEIMSELSTVNYWDKYGEIAFDATQKAVLTSCVLQLSASARAYASGSGPGNPVRCCFSFTLRRDKHKIPVAIVGNFLPAP
ncbi:Transcription factor, partial [Coemansia nantahalensis]